MEQIINYVINNFDKVVIEKEITDTSIITLLENQILDYSGIEIHDDYKKYCDIPEVQKAYINIILNVLDAIAPTYFAKHFGEMSDISREKDAFYDSAKLCGLTMYSNLYYVLTNKDNLVKCIYDGIQSIIRLFICENYSNFVKFTNDHCFINNTCNNEYFLNNYTEKDLYNFISNVSKKNNNNSVLLGTKGACSKLLKTKVDYSNIGFVDKFMDTEVVGIREASLIEESIPEIFEPISDYLFVVSPVNNKIIETNIYGFETTENSICTKFNTRLNIRETVGIIKV